MVGITPISPLTRAKRPRDYDNKGKTFRKVYITGTKVLQSRPPNMNNLSNLTDRFATAGTLLLAALPLLALGAFGH